MISQLAIRNFGLIDDISVDFSGKLNVFTGETGAGKSILIDALRYCLGEKLVSTQIRDASKVCSVEAVFDLDKDFIKEAPILAEYIQGGETQLIISRQVAPDGKNRNKVNGFTVTLSQLKEIGDHLVDFHGPHDHQMLLAESSHLLILDRLAGADLFKAEYDQKYDGYLSLTKQLEELNALSQTKSRELDMLTHQLKELEAVPLDANKYEELKQSAARVANAEKLYASAARLLDMLENGEAGIMKAVGEAFGPLRSLNDTDESTRVFTEIFTRLQEDSSRLQSMLSNYLESLSFDQKETERTAREIDAYYGIIHKYGPTLEDAKNFYDSAKHKHDLLVDLEHNDAELRSKISSSEKSLKASAEKITIKRKAAAKGLRATIEAELKELGMEHVKFECRVEKAELGRFGSDKVTFYLSPNAGENLKPLAEIVSSGEAARMMLALKKALTKADPIPVLIFDEIDSQIGGRLGAVTGKKLKELSSDRQVILITHLPQIASFADSHFKVSKKIQTGRTVTIVLALGAEDKVKELAKMMSGEKESQIAVKHAEDMLTRAGTCRF